MKTYMNKNGHQASILGFSLLGLVAASLFLAGCDQSPIFYNISLEEPRKTAIVDGTPSTPVVFSGKLWIANGKLYSKSAAGSWTESAPNNASNYGKIRELAATSVRLHALAFSGDTLTTRLFYTDDGLSWSSVVATNVTLETIFSANNALFVGGRSETTSSIYYLSGNNLVQIASADGTSCALVGAAYDGSAYYLATVGAGIYRGTDLTTPDFTLAAAPTTLAWANARLNGICSIGGDILAVGRGSKLVYKRAADSVFSAADLGVNASGALALWDSSLIDLTDADTDTNPDLLLIGVADESNGLYGYRELALSAGLLPATFSFVSPGIAAATSVSNADSFKATLGLVPVVHLYQHDNGQLYASTYQKGLWLYDGSRWNTEE